MNTLLSTPIVGKCFILRLLTAPIGIRNFGCLAEEKSDNLIKFHLMEGLPGRDINDLLRNWARTHGYAKMCIRQCEKGLLRDVEFRVR